MASHQYGHAGVCRGWMTEWIPSHTHSRWMASPQCEYVDEFPTQMGNWIPSHSLHISMVSPWLSTGVGGMQIWALYQISHDVIKWWSRFKGPNGLLLLLVPMVQMSLCLSRLDEQLMPHPHTSMVSPRCKYVTYFHAVWLLKALFQNRQAFLLPHS